MDTQLIFFWIMLLVVGLAIDIGVYLFLRADWRKTGVLRTDAFFDRIFDQLSQLQKTIKNSLNISLVRYYRDSVPALASASTSVSENELEPVMDTDPVEIIPISVENVGQMRHIQFSLDLPLDSQVDVRIGATNEAGVTVQKREL
jgi:hypothetical protein